MMRQQKTMHSQLFDTYLQEYMWRRQFVKGDATFIAYIYRLRTTYIFLVISIILVYYHYLFVRIS